MTDPKAGQWWLDAARAEARIGVFDGPDPDVIPDVEEYSAADGRRMTWPESGAAGRLLRYEPVTVAPDPWMETNNG